jgi:hypothetical protein
MKWYSKRQWKTCFGIEEFCKPRSNRCLRLLLLVWQTEENQSNTISTSVRSGNLFSAKPWKSVWKKVFFLLLHYKVRLSSPSWIPFHLSHWNCYILYGNDATHRPDDGGSKDLRNVGELIPVYTELKPRRQPSSCSLPWEPQIIRVAPTAVRHANNFRNTVTFCLKAHARKYHGAFIKQRASLYRPSRSTIQIVSWI